MTKHLKVVIAECPEKVVPEVRALIEIHSYDLLSADRLDMSYLSLHKKNNLTNSEVFKKLHQRTQEGFGTPSPHRDYDAASRSLAEGEVPL